MCLGVYRTISQLLLGAWGPTPTRTKTFPNLAGPHLRLQLLRALRSSVDSRTRMSNFVTLVVPSQIEPRPREMNRVRADLVAQQPPRGRVVLARHNQTACQAAQS